MIPFQSIEWRKQIIITHHRRAPADKEPAENDPDYLLTNDNDQTYGGN